MSNYWLKIKNWNEQNKTWLWGGIGGVIITLIVTVAITIYSNSGKQNPPSSINNNENITILGNNNPTFKDIKSTTGDFITHTDKGSIIVNKTIIQGIPHEQYLKLAKELGVTENILKNLFKIIEEKEVLKNDWEETLRQIAQRHKELLSRLDQFNVTIKPKIKELRLKAEDAINEGDYDSAKKYLDDALERQMVCINKADKAKRAKALPQATDLSLKKYITLKTIIIVCIYLSTLYALYYLLRYELLIKSNISVFIYGHKDKKISERIKNELEKEGFHVIIDIDAMKTGEKIETFIKKCIRESSVTLLIVSSNSLLSEWVALEVIYSKYESDQRKRYFMHCVVDNSIFDREFIDKAQSKIDKEIEELGVQINRRINKDKGIEHLHNERKRLRTLDNKLSEIIGKLKDELCTDLSEKHFDNGIKKIIDDLHSYKY